MNNIRTAGVELQKIQNKTYNKYSTEKGEKIVLALEKSRIPYFARFNGEEIFLTYDSNYKDSVEEIIRKILSGVYDEIVAELKRKKDNSGFRELIPEIANILNTSVSFLKSRPDEVQEILCKRYIDLWCCDTPTIKRELSEIISLDNTEEHYISSKIHRRRTENQREQQIQTENRIHSERERRF